MTLDDDRARALEYFGYTTRQSQFLVLVALHGGYFLRRQYVAFTGCGHGQAAVRFLASAVSRGHVQMLPYGRHGHVFHLGARPLYAAIGEEHNRNRRAAEWDAVIRKLMTVDFVLARRDARFWATEADKAALLRELRIDSTLWPARTYNPRRRPGTNTTRHFVDKMPWYRDTDDARLWITYVDAERTLQGFETFLRQYRDLFTALTCGVTYVSTDTWSAPVQQVFAKVVGAVTAPTTASSADLVNYFRLRRVIEEDRLAGLSVDEIYRYTSLRRRFATTQIDDLFKRWLCDGDAALVMTDGEQVSRPACVLRIHRLEFDYEHHATRRSSSRAPTQVT